jgi:hypothetical protein
MTPLGRFFYLRLKGMNANNLDLLKKLLNWLQNGAAKSAASAGSCPA